MLPTLFVLVGSTAVGKTALSLRVAEMLQSPILSADSRQMFRDLPIGTAAPTPEDRARVKHYFVGTLGLEDYYSAAQYEQDVLALTKHLFEQHDALLLTGGSMMYVDAVCNGIDDIPTISSDIRHEVAADFEKNGLEPLLAELQRRDPEYHAIVDPCNHKRVVHALEVIRQTGKPLTVFRTGQRKKRPFRVVKIGLQRPREELFARINHRTTLMVEVGFLDEARRVMPFRSCNSLNTVGYKEIFRYFDGEWALDMALDRIRKNTRVYAKKQMTWFAKDQDIRWFHPEEEDALLRFVQQSL
ncbi:tRNA (adenosine(37)-N6)-dimethylallyltransferase MiaA [Alloprevotella sp. OH1205_COT-284]|uniref:tRNA (adenosine(37)-N6)-dimethylallyltransferase MiaA n=1 Tax=Alloprevotella sp. OH1205_COT-284 TaxID=2491043 RepID=UPI000F5FEEF4|nr:tRNA (adenosine(37)-N6)-dimethylallyltransferase MiaA [Alloprevotella sp. OH1205_COT-284]RRD76325.1 tRNA (adenosine(37)-N6)-dimethylallyltransferase MiaA [Alloprevotella sp. OH1205_COT-284]